MWGGSDRTDSWPKIKTDLVDSGLVEQWRAAGISINPKFVEIELISAEARYLSERFFDLSYGRSSSGFGVTPLTWLDIDAYCRVRKVKFSNWELDMIRILDAKYCQFANPPRDK